MNKTLYRKAACSDCKNMWNGYCPLCKQLGNFYFDEDGKRVRRKDMTSKGVKRINRPHWFTAIVGIKIKPLHKPSSSRALIKEGYSDDKKFWMKRHPKRVVALILRGHDPACLCCLTSENLTFDHVIPIAKKGHNELSNGQILCKACNVLKGDKIISIDKLKELMNESIQRNRR